MIRLPRAKPPRVALGIASVVLAASGLVLLFLPVLGAPLSAIALLIAVIGVGVALGGGDVRLRWSVLGLGLSALALGINVAIAYAPSGYVGIPRAQRMWQGENDRPRIPPPARPGSWTGEAKFGHAPAPREARELDATNAPTPPDR
jgi:phosphate/sulfate permease